MAKPKHSLKLYAKPEEGKSFGELDFVWLADKEPIPDGFKRVKKIKGGGVDYMKISELIYVKATRYDDGGSEKKLHIHPIIYFAVVLLLIVGGYLAY